VQNAQARIHFLGILHLSITGGNFFGEQKNQRVHPEGEPLNHLELTEPQQYFTPNIHDYRCGWNA